MFKYNVGLFVIVFISLTLKQLTFNDTIYWVDNIGFSIAVFLAYSFWEWAMKTNKNKE